MLKDSNIKYTTDGKRHLGAVIGSVNFRREYSNEKVMSWCLKIEKLAEIAILEPQAAYSAYIHGQQHKFNYFLQTIPGMENYIDPLDIVINDRLLPAILGRTISDLDREIFKLPIRDGGLGIPILSNKADNYYTPHCSSFLRSEWICWSDLFTKLLVILFSPTQRTANSLHMFGLNLGPARRASKPLLDFGSMMSSSTTITGPSHGPSLMAIIR